MKNGFIFVCNPLAVVWCVYYIIRTSGNQYPFIIFRQNAKIYFRNHLRMQCFTWNIAVYIDAFPCIFDNFDELRMLFPFTLLIFSLHMKSEKNGW